MGSLEQLSDSQRQIYDLLVAGKNSQDIARKLDSTVGVVEAQKTRMRNKSIALPGEAGYVPVNTTAPPTHVPTSGILSPPSKAKPLGSGPSENTRIADDLGKAGPALDADQLRKLADKVGGSTAKDIHPMVLLGVTIQFVKLCGGRMTAHQVIEDVYGALRAFATEGTLAGDEGGTAAPVPQGGPERAKYLEEQNKLLADEVQRLKAKEGAYSSGSSDN